MEYEDLLAEVEFLNHRNIPGIRMVDLLSDSLSVMLDGDKNFQKVQKKGTDDLWIQDKFLLMWLIDLNLHLARKGVFSIPLHMFRKHFISVLHHLGLDKPPEWLEDRSQSSNLISIIPESKTAQFPYALLLNSFKKVKKKLRLETIQDFMLHSTDKNKPSECWERILSHICNTYSPMSYVITKREGLHCSKESLRQIGRVLRLSPEGVRRKEIRFWEQSRKDHIQELAADSLLDFFFQRSGSLILLTNHPEHQCVQLLSRVLEIPFKEIPELHLSFFCVQSNYLTFLEKLLSKKRTKFVNLKEIKSLLLTISDSGLSEKDLDLITQNLHSFYWSRMSCQDRAYLALRKIGKPAHYTAVCEIHNEMFPEHQATDRNIHTYLQNDQGKRGVIWIGVHGTFALKEWGYKKPEIKLYDLVSSIVRKIYAETNKPVTLTAIHAEVSKVRKMVNPNSVTMAASLNPELESLNWDKFIPIEASTRSKQQRFKEDTFADFVISRDDNKNSDSL